jgi:hypothetical protein
MARGLGRPMTRPLDEMHQALGEFLTEMGRVEFRMLLLMDLINEAPIEALFGEYSGNPFGTKIRIFKKWCDFGGVPDEQKRTLQKVYKDLGELHSKRNFIVHGETWEGTFKGKSRQPYRVGLVEGNLEYLDEFERAEHRDNVFDVQQVRAATQLCVRIHGDLADMRERIAATAVPFEEEVDASKWPPPKPTPLPSSSGNIR